LQNNNESATVSKSKSSEGEEKKMAVMPNALSADTRGGNGNIDWPPINKITVTRVVGQVAPIETWPWFQNRNKCLTQLHLGFAHVLSAVHL